MPAGPSCAGKAQSSAPDPAPRSVPARTTSCASSSSGLEPVVASRSPKPTTGGSTPSEPAPRPAASRDTRTLTTAEASSGPAANRSRTRVGRAMGRSWLRPAVFRHRGFESSPAHRCASRLTGRAPGSYPGRDWVRGPGRALCRRGSARSGAGGRAGGRGCGSRADETRARARDTLGGDLSGRRPGLSPPGARRPS
jgi:hypothetical protein